MQAGKAQDTPAKLDTPGKRAVYNNIHNSSLLQTPTATGPDASDETAGDAQDRALELALKIDNAIKMARPDGWRGVQAKELVIKRALYDVLKNVEDVERLFLIIFAQSEY